ncbi:MAG: ORF6N domain-containing protein, partial [Bacteroidota bacterium]
PMAFTEQGVAQLSGVLNSKRAIKVNIQIIRLFTQMRKLLLNHKELILKVEKMESRLDGQSHEIRVLFEYLKKLMVAKEQVATQPNRKRIGYK